MGLKNKLLTQNLIVLISTIAITACVGFVYFYFLNLFSKAPDVNGAVETAVVVIENDNIIYQSKNFTGFQIKEMLMNLSVDKNHYLYNNTDYIITSESFVNGKDNYIIIKMTPSLNLDSFYFSLIIFTSVVFLLTFIIASVVVQKQNTNEIIMPIKGLMKQTNNIRNGELETAVSTEGYGEVGELGKTIEELRLELKNSIYYQKKVDDNRKFLISSISHDLKTPVTSIRGYIDGVLEGIANTDEKKSEYLKKAVAKTNLINTMIEDLLLYSKLDLNQMPFDIAVTDINKYIEDSVKDNTDDFERENKTISFSSELSDKTLVRIDHDKFKRVAQNIIDNAKKNIEGGYGRLDIKLRETSSSVILEFNDNGRGINQEDLPYIFDRFYRADSARSIEGSSGLGLAIAKQIVEGLGGRIWALSKAGSGASIMISLKKSL